MFHRIFYPVSKQFASRLVTYYGINTNLTPVVSLGFLWKGLLGKYAEKQFLLPTPSSSRKRVWNNLGIPSVQALHLIDLILLPTRNLKDFRHTWVMPSTECLSDHSRLCYKLNFSSPSKRTEAPWGKSSLSAVSGLLCDLPGGPTDCTWRTQLPGGLTSRSALGLHQGRRFLKRHLASQQRNKDFTLILVTTKAFTKLWKQCIVRFTRPRAAWRVWMGWNSSLTRNLS